MFSVAAMKARTFSNLPRSADEQGCRSREGAQPGSYPSWPMQIFHIMGVMLSLWMGVSWRGGGQESIFVVSVGLNSLESRSSDFFGNFTEFVISGFRSHYLRTGWDLVAQWQENCIVYSFVCKFIIIIIIIILSSSINIYFVVLLNSISTHEFYLLSISAPHLCWGAGEGQVSGCRS